MVGKTLPRKLVVLGDGACGKTSLLTVFTKGYFPTTYEPTVFENYVEIMSIEGQTVELSLWDTAGQEDFDRLRSLSYADTHVIMICFSVDMPDSLENVETKVVFTSLHSTAHRLTNLQWIEEVNQFCPGVKIVLIALKCDLREDPTVREKLERRGMHTVTYDEGLAVARNIRANRYLECSAKHNRGVQEALHEAARVSISTKPKGNGGGPGGGGGGAKGDRLGSCCVVQ